MKEQVEANVSAGLVDVGSHVENLRGGCARNSLLPCTSNTGIISAIALQVRALYLRASEGLGGFTLARVSGSWA
jgi:hypothetical protein